MQHREHRENKTSKKLHLVSLFPSSVNSIRFDNEKEVKTNSVSSVKNNSVSSVVKKNKL